MVWFQIWSSVAVLAFARRSRKGSPGAKRFPIAPMQSVKVSFTDAGEVHFQFLGVSSSELDVPTEVLRRSTLLCQALQEASQINEVTMRLPRGVVEAWLEGIQTVEADVGLAGSSNHKSSSYSAHQVTPITRGEQLLNGLKV